MRRVPRLVLAVGLLAAFAFAAPAASAPPDHKNKYPNDETVTRDCGGDEDNPDTVTYGGPLKLWPPNHKLQAFTVTALEEAPDAGAMDTALEVSPSVTDVAGGDGNTETDWEGDLMATGDPDAVVSGALRAERSGRGDGRTYTLDWTAEFDDGSKICTSQVPAPEDQEGGVTYVPGDPFTVEVPHDMSGGAGWK